MRNLEILKVTEKEVRKNYSLENVNLVGHSINDKKISFNFEDLGVKLKIDYPTKSALRLIFESKKAKGEFKNCIFDEFEDAWGKGLGLDQIEAELKKNKLNFPED